MIEADLFDTHEPPPAHAERANQSFYDEVRTLKLDVARIVPIHGQPVPWADFARIMAAPASGGQ